MTPSNPCLEDDPCAKINGLSCSKDSFFAFIRESLADCEEPYAWSNDYIDHALDMSLLQVVNTNKDEFTRTKEITLVNDECIQSVCGKCEGLIEIVGNTNGDCDTPPKEINKMDTWLGKMYPVVCASEAQKQKYKINSYDILGDGGCEFKVNPRVPKTGIHKIHVLCLTYPNINGALPPELCRHMNEVMFLALGILFMLEDDRDILTEKADRWFNMYFKIVEIETQKDRDIFIESIKYGARINNTLE